MAYHHHTASYEYGKSELSPEQRVVVSIHQGLKEPRRVAKHLGLSEYHPQLLLAHRLWSDEEYLPVFMTSACADQRALFRYKPNHFKPDGERTIGQGLKGRTVYIVGTFHGDYSPQDLDKRIEFIAWTAKYNGAEEVVLLSYTLAHSAQERGVHQLEHPRMQTMEARLKFEGQAPLAQAQLMSYALLGIDKVVNIHNHCPQDIRTLCEEVNAELDPLHQRSVSNNWTQRYHLDFVNIDLAPTVGMYVADFSERNLGFDLSESGKNVLFLGPDLGIEQFIWGIKKQSGLTNSALAIMNKKRASDGSGIELLTLEHTENLSPERGVEGMDVFIADDSIRSGETMRTNIEVLRGIDKSKLKRDPRIVGTPRRVAVYATRTNFAGNSRTILSSDVIDDIVITNADPRAAYYMKELYAKTQTLWINFIMGEAAKALERGQDPNDVLTTDFIRSRCLLKVDVPHGHQLEKDLTDTGII